jgi:hypothetical protein
MPVTRVKLNRQTEVVENVDWSGLKIVNLSDPTDLGDAANKAYVDTAIAAGGGGGTGSGTIGLPDVGDYTDGLFSYFTADTKIGTAVDKFNEILKSLSPQPAPNFSSISFNQTGVAGKLSFGSSNSVAGYTNASFVNINQVFSIVAGSKLGIINGTTALTGTLAFNVTPNYANSIPYPNYSFGDGDKGTIALEVNGSVIHQVDLSTFVSGSSLNANGSGFILSAATAVKFPNGDNFSVLNYRTGTWVIAVADQTLGYNTMRITHEPVGGVYRDSQVGEWIVDAETVATAFSSESLTTLAITGSRYLSGVNFHTGGTVKYNVTISNCYRNTFSSSATAVSYNPTNATMTKDALPNMVLNTDSISISNKTATISATRLLNGSVSVNTTLDRTVQTDSTSTGASIAGLLIDNTADNSTATNHTFNGESRRCHSGINITATSYGSGASGSQQSVWDSTQSLIGASNNYNNGLQVYNGLLQYPKTNLSTIANGPAGNPNYSTATGNRVWIGYFYDAGAHSNFRFNVVGTSISFVQVATGVSGNNLTFEVCAPNTTKNSIGTVEWKDCVKPHSGLDTDLGCYASTYGSAIPSNWGCTIGQKNTSTSGYVVLVKITASASWSGSISQIGITWL